MRVWYALPLLLVMLAGCGDPSTVQDVAAEPDLETGVLEGIILDAAIRPIADVDVRLEGKDIATISNDSGAWQIDGLAPGAYIVHASKDGLAAMQATATVVAGEVTQVSLEMAYNATAEPFAVPTHWQGFIDCSVRAGTGGTGSSVGLNACNPLGEQGIGEQDVNRVHQFDEGTPDWFQTEIQWTKSQSFGTDLAVMVGPDSCLEPKYYWLSGGSPLVYNMDGFELRARAIGPDVGLCTRVFAATSSDFAEVVGVAFQQEFDAYSHAFYNMEPADGWLFVVDGSP